MAPDTVRLRRLPTAVRDVMATLRPRGSEAMFAPTHPIAPRPRAGEAREASDLRETREVRRPLPAGRPAR